MKYEKRTTPIVLKNSPIEFVLVGPSRGHDRIIISSEGAGLDLKGLAVDRDSDLKVIKDLGSTLSLFTGSGRQLNVIESYESEDLDPEYDGRMSSFRFAWVGYCTPLRKEKIEKTLNRSLLELRSAIAKNSEADLELVFSPVVLGCSIAHQIRQRFKRSMLVTIAIYTLAGLAVATYGYFLMC